MGIDAQIAYITNGYGKVQHLEEIDVDMGDKQMTLIDKEKLESEMYHNAFEIDTDLQKWDSGCWIRYKMFENVIEKQPTVDAEPVRHGHWVKNDNGTYSCSECHSWIPSEQHHYARYCLFCGAKMDLGERK